MGNVRRLLRLFAESAAGRPPGSAPASDAALPVGDPALSLPMLARLAEEAPLVLWHFSPQEERFLFLSNYAESLLGYPIASWYEPGVFAARVLAEDLDGIRKFFSGCMSADSGGEFSFRVHAAAGGHVALRCLAVPLKSETVHAGSLLSGLFVDISSDFALASALGESESRFRAVMEQVPNISVQGYDSNRRVTFWNTASERLYGYSAHEANGKLLEDLIIPPAMREIVKSAVQCWVDEDIAIPASELILQRKNGQTVPVFSSHVMINSPVAGRQMYCLDVELTDMKEAERVAKESEKRFRLTFEEAPVGICICTPEGLFLEVNPAFCRICGYSPADLAGQDFGLLTHPDDRARGLALFQDCLGGGRNGYVIEKRYVRKDGRELWVELTASLLRDESGTALQFIGIVEDITERRASRERIAYLAHHDTLTGLPNRSLLQDRLNIALAHATRSSRLVALLFIDLDRFKNINDSLGHVIGDSLLKAVGQRLASHIRSGDTVSRQGGDEFILLLGEIESADQAMAVAQKMVEILERPYEVGGHLLSCSASIGVALFPEHGRDVDTLMRHADVAMYSAKDGGRNTARLFQIAMTRNAVERLKIENALRKALERKEFELHYQPQVELSSGRLIGVEALLRWNSAQLGAVPPGVFIPVAEDTGLIVSIGAWVLAEACRQIRAWQDAGIAVVPVAVNLSALQFNRSDVVDTMRRTLQETGVAPHLLELELTESLLMSNVEGVLQTMRDLKSLGFLLSIDDFGTGYSSLSYLKRFPVDRLKVDRSFVRDVVEDPDDAAIVRAIVQLGRSLKINVIAEGVESRQQIDFLLAEGCHSVQGYYYSKPVAAASLVAVLEAGLVRAADPLTV